MFSGIFHFVLEAVMPAASLLLMVIRLEMPLKLLPTQLMPTCLLFLLSTVAYPQSRAVPAFLSVSILVSLSVTSSSSL